MLPKHKTEWIVSDTIQGNRLHVGSKALAGGDAVSTLNGDKPPTMITVARDTDG